MRAQRTLLDFLKTALLPCGQTLYVWGGGWNKEDTGAGEDAVHIGLYPGWKAFFDDNARGYDYRDHRYCLGDGLDCSGYVGWVLYNTFESRSGGEGYVGKSTAMAWELSKRGLGFYIPHDEIDVYKPGDIVSIEGHIFIALETCSDGSIVVLHSSPQAGVQISGTLRPGERENGKREKSLAWKKADKAMETYFPTCHALFETKYCGEIYHTGNLFRFDYAGGILEDPQGLADMDTMEILKVIFGGN